MSSCIVSSTEINGKSTAVVANWTDTYIALSSVKEKLLKVSQGADGFCNQFVHPRPPWANVPIRSLKYVTIADRCNLFIFPHVPLLPVISQALGNLRPK